MKGHVQNAQNKDLQKAHTEKHSPAPKLKEMRKTLSFCNNNKLSKRLTLKIQNCVDFKSYSQNLLEPKYPRIRKTSKL